STALTPTPPTAPSSTCGPATAAPTRNGPSRDEHQDETWPPRGGGERCAGAGGTAGGARARRGRGRVAEREPRIGDRTRDRGRRGLLVRREPGRHSAGGPEPGAAGHHRVPRRRACVRGMDRRRIPERLGYPG